MATEPFDRKTASKRGADKKKRASRSERDLFEAEGDELFDNENAPSAKASSKKTRDISHGKTHKYGRNEGEGLSREKSVYNRERYNKLFKAERYTRKSVSRDREYGMFWYDWLWHLLRPILCFVCAILVVLGIVSLTWNKIYDGYIGPRDPDDVTSYVFNVASGESVTAIGNHLEEQGYIASSSLFKYYIQFYGLTKQLQSGVYDLSKSMDLFEVAGVLSSGKASNERTIRILPGWTIEDIADYLTEIGAINNKYEFLVLCRNSATNGKYIYEDYIDYSLALISANEKYDLKQRSYPLEGYLAPDTYRIYLNADAQSILRTLIKQSDIVYNELFMTEGADESGEYTGQAPTYGAKGVTLDSDQIYIMASIIEKEASNKEDMARVSAVFYNRLASGMKLQSDPTVKYLSDITGITLTGTQTSRKSPYNTYVIDGLPIGPICSPSKNALNAALHPDEEYLNDNYLFFCATEPASGELVFAKTYAEHQANVNKYRPLWEEYDRQHSQKTAK